MTRVLTVSLAVTALAVAGCGSSSKNSGSSSTPAAPASGGGQGAAVTMKNIAFAPKDITVKVGDTVTWTNEDDVQHNVTATGGATFKSSLFGKGKTYEFKATKPGTIKYVCTVHPGMDGTITVK